MKKIINSFVIYLLLINILSMNVYGLELNKKDYSINKVENIHQTKIPTIVKNNKIYVPIRKVAESLNIEVLWINEIDTVHLITNSYIEENIEKLYPKQKSGEIFVRLDNRFLNFPKVYEEGQDIFIEKGITYVPLESLAMALGKDVLIYEDTFEFSFTEKISETDGLPINEVTSLYINFYDVSLLIDEGVVYYYNKDLDEYDVLYDNYNIKSMFYIEDKGVYFIDDSKNVYLLNLDKYLEPVKELSSIVDIYYSGNSAFFVGDNGYYFYNNDTNTYDKTDLCLLPIKAPAYVFENIVMSFVGDIYLSDYVLKAYDSGGINNILDKKIQDEFANSNITMVNQEFAFTNRGTKADDKQFTFRVNPSYGKIFTEMNVDLVSLANNHALDFGVTGLKDSFDTLNKINIEYVGAGNNLTEAKAGKYYTVNDKTIGIVGATRVIPVYNWGATNSTSGMLSTYDPSITTVTSAINETKTKSDFVVVYVHWGIEKEAKPEQYQRDLAKKYIDAGADLVVGSHPHVLQGIEYYNGKPIVYSLGNFMFYNSIDNTAILKAYIDENNEIKLQLLPSKASNSKTYLVDNSQEKEKFYRYIESISYNVTFDKDGFVNIAK